MFSFDPSTAFEAFDSHTRIVCQNTFNAARSHAANGKMNLRVLHISGGNQMVDDMKREITAMFEKREAFYSSLEFLASRPLTLEESERIIASVIASDTPKKEITKFGAKHIAGITDKFTNGIKTEGKTAYDLFNAATEYYTTGDGSGKQPNSKYSSSEWGTGARRKGKVFDALQSDDLSEIIAEGDYTWNPVGGCQHGCRWKMPDGKVAVCYAETVANKFRQAYPDGFEHHYWREHFLSQPAKIQQPSRIFMDSMSDLMGAWVPDDQILRVFETVSRTPRHSFQLLTKNPARLAKFAGRIPDNVWIGASSPPDFFRGKELTAQQREAMLSRTLDVLGSFRETHVTWMSIEPLSWHVADILDSKPALRWAVIGAATHGVTVYQIDPELLRSTMKVLSRQKVPVFFKGNLWGNPALSEVGGWQEFFPGFEPSRYQGYEMGSHAIPKYDSNGGLIPLPEGDRFGCPLCSQRFGDRDRARAHVRDCKANTMKSA
ncbi:MAG: DUF5131 family protein [Verrucomicrobiales bacterium]